MCPFPLCFLLSFFRLLEYSFLFGLETPKYQIPQPQPDKLHSVS